LPSFMITLNAVNLKLLHTHSLMVLDADSHPYMCQMFEEQRKRERDLSACEGVNVNDKHTSNDELFCIPVAVAGGGTSYSIPGVCKLRTGTVSTVSSSIAECVRSAWIQDAGTKKGEVVQVDWSQRFKSVVMLPCKAQPLASFLGGMKNQKGGSGNFEVVLDDVQMHSIMEKVREYSQHGSRRGYDAPPPSLPNSSETGVNLRSHQFVATNQPNGSFGAKGRSDSNPNKGPQHKGILPPLHSQLAEANNDRFKGYVCYLPFLTSEHFHTIRRIQKRLKVSSDLHEMETSMTAAEIMQRIVKATTTL